MLKLNLQKSKIILIFLLIFLLAGVLIIAHDSTFGSSTTSQKELPIDKMDTYTHEFSSHLPIIVIQTDVAELHDKSTPPKAVIWLFDNDAVLERENRLTDIATAVFDFAAVHYRGRSSYLLSPKNPYMIFLENAMYEPLNYSFFGLDAMSEWVLRSPYADKSLLRDWFGYEIAATVLDWQPRGKPVQLFLQDGQNGEITYQGVYFLCHYIPAAADGYLKLGEFRLNRSESIDMNGGGYLFQINRSLGNSNVTTDDDQNYRVMYPRLTKVTETQSEYLTAEVKFFHNFTNKVGDYENVSGEQWDYRNYVDVDSFMDYYLVAELLKIADAGWYSTYMYRPLGGYFYAGPIWDCDLSMGNASYYSSGYDGFWTFHRIPIIINLLEDPSFSEELIERWQDLRGSIWADEEMLGLFDEMVEYLRLPAAQNAERWPELYDGETPIWANPIPYTQSWEEEIDRTREWLVMRLQWLDENIPRLISESPWEIGYDQ